MATIQITGRFAASPVSSSAARSSCSGSASGAVDSDGLSVIGPFADWVEVQVERGDGGVGLRQALLPKGDGCVALLHDHHLLCTVGEDLLGLPPAAQFTASTSALTEDATAAADRPAWITPLRPVLQALSSRLWLLGRLPDGIVLGEHHGPLSTSEGDVQRRLWRAPLPHLVDAPPVFLAVTPGLWWQMSGSPTAPMSTVQAEAHLLRADVVRHGPQTPVAGFDAKVDVDRAAALALAAQVCTTAELQDIAVQSWWWSADDTEFDSDIDNGMAADAAADLARRWRALLMPAEQHAHAVFAQLHDQKSAPVTRTREHGVWHFQGPLPAMAPAQWELCLLSDDGLALREGLILADGALVEAGVRPAERAVRRAWQQLQRDHCGPPGPSAAAGTTGEL